MIQAKARRNAAGELFSLELRGHAGTGPWGTDIVCAAVSALAQTAVLGLEQALGLHPTVEQRSGFFRCTLDVEDTRRREAQAILETTWLGLQDIAHDHPKALRVDEDPEGG